MVHGTDYLECENKGTGGNVNVYNAWRLQVENNCIYVGPSRINSVDI
jgi:hypothetical protein